MMFFRHGRHELGSNPGLLPAELYKQLCATPGTVSTPFQRAMKKYKFSKRLHLLPKRRDSV